jgi:hypothetical protein
MKKISLLSLAGIALASSFSTSYATLNGVVDPFGRNINPDDTQSVIWDSFTETVAGGSGPSTTYTYSGNTSGTPTFSGVSLNQTSPHINAATGGGGAQGAGLLNGGDVYYSSTRAQSWTLTATTEVDIGMLSFQIKTANLEGPTNAAALDTIYQPTLTGVGAATQIGRRLVPGEFSNGFQVYAIEYRWFNLDIDAGSTLNITFNLVGGSGGAFTRKPIDAIALDSTTVPEPSTYALLALGVGIVAWKVRRRALRH